MGYATQLLIALLYLTGTKLMLRQSSSTLVIYVNYLIVISININENCQKKKKKKKKKNKGGKGVVNLYLRIEGVTATRCFSPFFIISRKTRKT